MLTGRSMWRRLGSRALVDALIDVVQEGLQLPLNQSPVCSVSLCCLLLLLLLLLGARGCCA